MQGRAMVVVGRVGVAGAGWRVGELDGSKEGDGAGG